MVRRQSAAALGMCAVLFAIAQQRVHHLLPDPDPGTGTCYGRSVAIHEDHVFVGEPDPGGDGRVHVFHRNAGGLNNWGWVQTIEPPEEVDAQMLHTGSNFGFVAVAGEGVLHVLRPASVFYLEDVNSDVCSWHALYTYELGANGVWELTASAGGQAEEMWRCSYYSGCDYLAVPLMVGSSDLVARGQYNIDVLSGSMNQPPIARPGVGLSQVPLSSLQDTVIYSSTMWPSLDFDVVALSGDTVVIGGQEGLIMMRMGLGAIGVVPLPDVAPDIQWGSGVSPIDATDGLLAVGHHNDGGISPEAGSVLFYDLGQAPPVFLGSVSSMVPTEGGRFGSDVALQSGFLAVLSEPADPDQAASIELFLPCAEDPGWCSSGWLTLPDDAPTLRDAFRMNQYGEFVVATGNAVHLFFDPFMDVVELDNVRPLPEIRSMDNEQLVVRLPREFHQAQLVVRDLLGRTIHVSRASGPTVTVPLADLASGVHLIQVAQERSSATLKFIKP